MRTASEKNRKRQANYVAEHAFTQGDLLNKCAILQRFGITLGSWDYHQDHGWPAIGDEPLKPDNWRQLPYGQKEGLYLESNVKAAVETPTFPIKVPEGTWSDRRTFRPAGQPADYISAGESGIPRASVDRYCAKPCRRLLDKKGNPRRLEFLRVTPPFARNTDKVLVLLVADCDAIKAPKDAPNGRVTNSDLVNDFGIRPSYWTRKKSKLRPQQKALRFKVGPSPLLSGPTFVRLFSKPDAENIVNGDELHRPGSGPSGLAARHGLLKRNHAIEVIEEILAGSVELSPSEVIEQAAKQGVKSGIIYKVKKKKLVAINVREGKWSLRDQPGSQRKKRGPKPPDDVVDDSDPVVREIKAHITYTAMKVPGETVTLLKKEGLAPLPVTLPLDGEDISILKVLHRHAGHLKTAQQIAGLSSPRVSERTVGKRMPALRDAGLVARRGKRSGWAITPAGSAAQASAD